MNWLFGYELSAAKKKNDATALTKLSKKWNDQKSRMSAAKHASEYGTVDPITYIVAKSPSPAPAAPPSSSSGGTSGSGSGSGSIEPVSNPNVATEAPTRVYYTPLPTPSAESPGPPVNVVPAPGEPAREGEYYSNSGEVWAGGAVTKRACEIKQKGAKGACTLYGYPWGGVGAAPAAAPAVNVPAAAADLSTPGVSGGGGGGYDLNDPSFVIDYGAQAAYPVSAYYDTENYAPEADATDAYGTGIAPEETELVQAAARPAPASDLPWGKIAIGVALVLATGGAVKRRRRKP